MLPAFRDSRYIQVYHRPVDPKIYTDDEQFRQDIFRNVARSFGWDTKTTEFILENHMKSGDITRIVQVTSGDLTTRNNYSQTTDNILKMGSLCVASSG